MVGAGLGTLAALLLLATGLTITATLGVRSLPEVLLGVYVVVYAEVVLIALAVSRFDGIRRPILLIALGVVAAGSVWHWWYRGRPLIPGVVLPRMRDASVLVLAVGACTAFAYSLVLAIRIPPNNWDSLSYHLTRAALWRQEASVGYIANAYDGRLNANPPNAEVVLAFVLEVTRNERFLGLVQLSAWVACGLAIVALARRVGLGRREALFGALVFMLLPVVVLQSTTAQNDLVLASLLLAAAVFITRKSGSELTLAGMATAVAVGVKVTALLGLPLLVAIGLAAHPPEIRAKRTVALGVGAVAGAYWYGVNLVRTDSLLGVRPDRDLVILFQPRENVLAGLARILDAIELTGVRDWGVYGYYAVAVVFSLVLVVVALGGRIHLRAAAGAGYLVVLTPVALLAASYLLWRFFAKLHNLLGTPDGELPVRGWETQTLPSEDLSWYGPTGIVLVVGLAVAATVLVRRGDLPLIAAVLAFAPLAWLVLASVSLAYDPWQGRFFMFPVALSAALWGLLVRRPPLAWATTAVTVTIAALSLAQYHERPPSLVRDKARWEAQSIHRASYRTLLSYAETRIPRDATVALALSENHWGYPVFGARMERKVLLVPFGSSATDTSAGWLLASAGRARTIDPGCWNLVLAAGEGSIFRQRPVCGD